MLLLGAALAAWWGGSFLFMWGLCVAASGRAIAEPASVALLGDESPLLAS